MVEYEKLLSETLARAELEDGSRGTSESEHKNTENYPSGDGPDRDTPKRRAVFLRQGDYWIIGWNGNTSSIKNSFGLNYIALLLSHQGKEMSCEELFEARGSRINEGVSIGDIPELPISNSLGSPVPTIDQVALQQYEAQRKNLRAQRPADRSVRPLMWIP